MECNCESVWEACLEYLQGRMPTGACQTWLAATDIAAIDNDLVTVTAPNKFVADWIGSRYSRLIDEALLAVTGSPKRHRVEIHVGDNGSTIRSLGHSRDDDFGPDSGNGFEGNGHEDELEARALAEARARAAFESALHI